MLAINLISDKAFYELALIIFGHPEVELSTH